MPDCFHCSDRHRAKSGGSRSYPDGWQIARGWYEIATGVFYWDAGWPRMYGVVPEHRYSDCQIRRSSDRGSYGHVGISPKLAINPLRVYRQKIGDKRLSPMAINLYRQ